MAHERASKRRDTAVRALHLRLGSLLFMLPRQFTLGDDLRQLCHVSGGPDTHESPRSSSG